MEVGLRSGGGGVEEGLRSGGSGAEVTSLGHFPIRSFPSRPYVFFLFQDTTGEYAEII